jgi:hypothetical protein
VQYFTPEFAMVERACARLESPGLYRHTAIVAQEFFDPGKLCLCKSRWKRAILNAAACKALNLLLSAPWHAALLEAPRHGHSHRCPNLGIEALELLTRAPRLLHGGAMHCPAITSAFGCALSYFRAAVRTVVEVLPRGDPRLNLPVRPPRNFPHPPYPPKSVLNHLYSLCKLASRIRHRGYVYRSEYGITSGIYTV